MRRGQVHVYLNFYSQDIKQDLKAELPPLNHQRQIPPAIFFSRDSSTHDSFLSAGGKSCDFPTRHLKSVNAIWRKGTRVTVQLPVMAE